MTYGRRTEPCQRTPSSYSRGAIGDPISGPVGISVAEAGADVAASLIAADPLTGLSVDVRVRMLLVHQAQGFRERGVSVSFSYDPTPLTPLGFTAPGGALLGRAGDERCRGALGPRYDGGARVG